MNTSIYLARYFLSFRGISWQRERIPDNARSLYVWIFPLRRATSSLKASTDARRFSNFCADALLTRYAGDKFERSQHAYRAQRAQIHIQVYALRERRDDPVPKTHTPATLYYLLLYYTNTHATLKYLDYGH